MYSDSYIVDKIHGIVDPSKNCTGKEIIKLVEEKFTSTSSPKLPLYSDIKEKLQNDLREPDDSICLNWFWDGVKRCYKLIENSQHRALV